jgi:hypothetical protein
MKHGGRMRGWSGVMATPLALWESLWPANLKGVDCPDNIEPIVERLIVLGAPAIMANGRERMIVRVHGSAPR